MQYRCNKKEISKKWYRYIEIGISKSVYNFYTTFLKVVSVYRSNIKYQLQMNRQIWFFELYNLLD